MKLSKALWISAALILAALFFNAAIFIHQGQQKALEFLTGYIIELSLSIDNLFIFFLIFSHFKVEANQQQKILIWGLLGALLMRAILILAGVSLLNTFSWIVYVFGILLVILGFQLFFQKKKAGNFDQNPLLCALQKFIPKGLSLFMLVLVLVEGTDMVFAFDSIPAVLAVTKDPFIVYSSNIFAILGLRSMYFILSPVIDKFVYLHYTLGIILTFTGIKMLLDPVWHMPIVYALGFIALVLASSVVISVNKNKELL